MRKLLLFLMLFALPALAGPEPATMPSVEHEAIIHALLTGPRVFPQIQNNVIVRGLTFTSGSLNVNITGGGSGGGAVTGTLTNNNAAPGANNIGALGCLANAANPTWTEGNLVLCSVNLSGYQRVLANQGTSPWVVTGAGGTFPVTGTFFQATQPVSIAGTVAVTQSTSPWVVSGTVTTTPPANASTNLTQVAGVTLGATAVTNFGVAPAATAVPGVNSSIFAGTTGITATGSSLNTNVTNTVATTLASTTVTNTVAENLTQVAGVTLGATAVTAYGTAPAAANVPGVNAFITNTVPVTLTSTTITGTSTVQGNRTPNTAIPGATNFGVLPCQANAASPSWTETFLVPCSVDLTGRERIRGTLTNNNAAPAADQLSVLPCLANAANPSWTEGFQVLESCDLNGRQRIMGQVGVGVAFTGNPVTVGGVDTAGLVRSLPVGTSGTAVLPNTLQVGGSVTTAAPTYTTGTSNPLSLDTAGNLRVTPTAIGTLTNNNAAPGTINIGVLPCLANAASPSWTEGNQVLCSVDLTGRERIRGTLGDNGVAATTDRLGTLPGIYQNNYNNGTAGTQGNNAALSVGTDGLLWTASLPSIRPASYVASSTFAGSSTTDNAVMVGSASNTILLTGIKVSCTQTTAGIVTLSVIKRSTADTGGTSASMTAVPEDSNYAAAAATALSYTGTGPTVGTPVGNIDSYKLGCMAPGTATPNDIYIWNGRQKPIVLRGVAQEVAINFGGAITGGSLSVTWEWISTATILP